MAQMRKSGAAGAISISVARRYRLHSQMNHPRKLVSVSVKRIHSMDGRDAAVLLAKHCNHEGIFRMDGIVKKTFFPLAFGSKARPIGCRKILT